MIELLQNQVVFSGLLALALIGGILLTVAYSIYFERKIAAWVQDRHGPNRVGPRGLLQPIADGAKFLLKEDIIPDRVDKPLFIAAPAIAFILAMIGFVVIPWGGQLRIGEKLLNVQVASPDVGLLYILAVGSMGVYGVVLGGWASNNKYSLYGAVRATAQMLSYEIPMGVAILTVVLTTGHVRLEQIVVAQTGETWPVSVADPAPASIGAEGAESPARTASSVGTSRSSDGAGGESAASFGTVSAWNIFLHPVAFLILLITIFAETNRTPFDLAEAEQELVGGFHTEYSAMKFALFFLGEYAHIITGCGFLTVLFLGGWQPIPFVSIPGFRIEDTGICSMILKMGATFAKVVFFIFVFMWVRWTLPRFRFDQLMRLAWKGLIPMSLGVMFVSIAGLYFNLHRNIVFTLTGNLIVVVVSLWIAASSRRPLSGRQANLPVVEPGTGGTGVTSAIGVHA